MATTDFNIIVPSTLNIIAENEGDYGSINSNDGGALSIGRWQWNASRALGLLREISKVDPTLTKNVLGADLYNEVMNTSTNWDKRKVDRMEESRLTALLKSPTGIKVQNEVATRDITGYVKQIMGKGITNSQAIVFIADIQHQAGQGVSDRIIASAIAKAGSADKVTLEMVYQIALADETAGDYDKRRNITNMKAKQFQNYTVANTNIYGNTETSQARTLREGMEQRYGKYASEHQATEPYIGFNDAGYLDLPEDLAMAMLDDVVKVGTERRAYPLSIFDNIEYKHRTYYDTYNLMLGDCFFMIPPEFITITSEATSQDIITLRQENTQKIKTGYHKKTIIIDLVFHGHEQINGFKVEGPEGFYYVDGLRQLLAQFKCTPFLPIINETINTTYDIHAVALQSIVCSTVEGFPDLMTANITLQEVNLFPYIEMHNRYFKYLIDWDLFRFYYQRQLTDDKNYKKLKKTHKDKSLSNFKISTLSPSIFESEPIENLSFADVVLDKKVLVKEIGEDGKETVAKTNYEIQLDSSIDNVSIKTFQCGYSNILTSIQMSDHGEPTIQYMGGMDTIFSIGFETTDPLVVQKLEYTQIMNDQMTRNNKRYASIGFVKLESELVEFCGSMFVMVDNITVSTVPEFPGLFMVQMNCVSFDINQGEREELHGFKPFNHTASKNDAIEQSINGLYTKIQQDTFAEKKMRDEIELYPDLKLPTYSEVDNFIEKVKTFRSTHNNMFGDPLSPLSYSKYPRNPVKMLHGVNTSKVDLKTDKDGFVTNVAEALDAVEKYDIYVDPDFYVFYPVTYAQIKKDNEEEGNDNPLDYKLTKPTAKQKNIKKYTFTGADDFTDSDTVSSGINLSGMTEKKQKFIEIGMSKLGSPYVWGAAGPTTFDCSGFISWILKEMGYTNSRFSTSSMLSMTSLFKEKPISEAQPGDLLHFKAGETRNIGHVAIYLGDNQILHCGGAEGSSQSKVNIRKADYVKFVRALEIIPLNTGKTGSSALTSVSAISYKVNFNLKLGDAGEDVRQLQILLNRLDNANLKINGKYDKETETAVRSFQKSQGINVDGEVGSETSGVLEKLANEYVPSSVTYSTSPTSDNITIEELEAIAKVVAAESRGESYKGQMAVAQCIYDRFTDPKKRWGNLNNVLSAKNQFAKPWTGNLETTTCLDAVKDIFCNGKKVFANDKVLYFLSPSAGISKYAKNDANYKNIGEIGAHTFWGESGAGSTKTFALSEDSENNTTSSASNDYFYEEINIKNGVEKVKDNLGFGKPVIMKMDYVVDNGFWGFKNSMMKEKYNSDLNIFNTMFVDMCEYSGRGKLIRAFPTYVFAIVDENGEWLDGRKLWSNYYIMRSMVDIQVYQANDMPIQTATITVSNNYHNLDKLPNGVKYYDVGDDDEYNGFFGLQKLMYKKFGLLLSFGPKLTDTLVEMKEIIYDTMRIRAGARMHLRMGYGSDPLGLPVVMNGFISDLSVGDLTTFVCVSDGVEFTKAILSDNPKDTNDIFDSQESSNMIANMLCKREKGFWNAVNKKWGEGNKFNIEHFGLYFNETIMDGIIIGAASTGGALGSAAGVFAGPIGLVVGGAVGGAVGGTIGGVIDWNNEMLQYDLCKNIYRSSYKKSLYIYEEWKGFWDGEKNLCFNVYNKTPWDALQMAVQNSPEYLGYPMYHQFDSRMYYGLPTWLTKYRYNIFNGKVYEESKAFSQVHFIDSINDIIDNRVTISSRDLYTNAIVMYIRGKSPKATPTLYSDKSIDWSKMKTKIFDTTVTQNLIGFDDFWHLVGIHQGEDGAIRVGTSQLLYNWEKHYQGEIFVIGDGSIKPNDYIFLNDTFIDMNGLCTARIVSHSLNSNTGFTTSIVPGMVGFSTMQNSQLSVTLTNAISVCTAFSAFTAIKKSLRDSSDYLSQYQNDAENWLFWGGLASTGIKGALAGVAIYKNIAMIKKIATTSINLAKSIKTLGVIKTAVTTVKGVGIAAKLATAGGIKGTLAAIGTGAAGPIGTAVGFAAGILLDVLLNKVIDYFAYNNCVVLLPLIYEGEPFCSVLTGDKLLLTNNANVSKETQYEKLGGYSKNGPGEGYNISDQNENAYEDEYGN